MGTIYQMVDGSLLIQRKPEEAYYIFLLWCLSTRLGGGRVKLVNCFINMKTYLGDLLSVIDQKSPLILSKPIIGLLKRIKQLQIVTSIDGKRFIKFVAFIMLTGQTS